MENINIIVLPVITQSNDKHLKLLTKATAIGSRKLNVNYTKIVELLDCKRVIEIYQN
jgi:hypothetical protein